MRLRFTFSKPRGGPSRQRGVTLAVVALATLCFPQQAAPDERQNIIDFLDQSIAWQQQVSAQQQVANEPSDNVFLGQDRDLSDQIIRLSFDFAKARAQTLAASSSSQPSDDSASASRFQNLVDATAKADAQVKDSQNEIQDFKRKAAAATGRERLRMESLITDSESELALEQARADTLHSLLNFSAGAKVKGKKSESLESQIEELARTVPALAVENKPESAPAAPATTSATESKPAGLFGLGSEVLLLRKKRQTLDAGDQLTDSLSQTSQALHAPLVQNWKGLTDRFNALLAEPDAQTPAGIAKHRSEVQALGAEFKTLSSSVVPLGKQAVLLDLYKRNLAAWRGTVQGEYSAALKSFIFRLAVLGIILGIVLAISELWRRATFRYIQDHRRRLQFLLMRRIVVWSAMAVIVVISLASQFGSLATFAGLLTAGLAVALQNVILSVVGYFFLIGKYGVRVGDRVQVAGVTGDVIDVGLVRLNMMEVGGFGSGTRPTGRVVVFPNAVVFQAHAGLFKQAPGAKFVWHEIGITLAPESDYEDAEKRMLDAVNVVFEEYKEELERQHHRMALALAPLTIATLEPEGRVRLIGAGLHVTIRYPVDLATAAEVDDRITRAILDATAKSPKLKIVGGSAPMVQTVTPVTPTP